MSVTQLLRGAPGIRIFSGSVLFIVFSSLFSCWQTLTCHKEMIELLKQTNQSVSNPKNPFASAAKLPLMDSLLNLEHSTPSQILYCRFLKANILVELGREDEAIRLLENVRKESNEAQSRLAEKDLALAYLRLGERSNCIDNHGSESCILPPKGMGIHRDRSGSKNAIEIYEKILTRDSTDLESRWLLNLAYMTLGEYPQHVAKQFLIPGMEGDTTFKVNAFQDIAADLHLDIKNMAGGSIIEDFDNDGYLDILTSGWGTNEKMHLFRNNSEGAFEDLSDKAGLDGITGGLNMVQADYNNDGYVDVLVLRGAWKKEYGKEPNSLLRNNGDNTFTDVTTKSGLLSFHPTQTATWNDFNNDGWLDLYIGNESVIHGVNEMHPCEFYINNQDGTFKEMARSAKIDVVNYVKGVTSGDYNNDGWKDIFISTMDGERKLFKNDGLKNGEVSFTNVTAAAHLDNEHGNTFPTWFWDYDNDGWLDLFACDYTFKRSLGYYEAAEKLKINVGSPEKMLLYHNNHDGTFTNVAQKLGLTTNVFAMGSNFGDIDNDGFLDMYLGSGNPDFKSLVPNKMFKNLAGKNFVEVTASARVGHLQKGHGVAFADVDNDGDQDIYIDMGGAYPGDSYQNAFFLNPGQNNNKWISISLKGKAANKSAIGTRIKITFRENNIQRSIYRDVNSGGSFGASPLRREIGLGGAKNIDEIEVQWHGSKLIQTFKNIAPNQFITITEGEDVTEQVQLKKINWTLPNKICAPLP